MPPFHLCFFLALGLAMPAIATHASVQQALLAASRESAAQQLLEALISDPPVDVLRKAWEGTYLPTDYEDWEELKDWMDYIRMQNMETVRTEVHRWRGSLPLVTRGEPRGPEDHERMLAKRQVVIDPSEVPPGDASFATGETPPPSASTSSSAVASSATAAGESGSVNPSSSASASESTTLSASATLEIGSSANAALASSSTSFSAVSTSAVTASIAPGAQLPVAGQNGQLLVEVVESNIQLDTPIGPIIQQCLTMVSDSTQTFCRTLLNGDAIGNDAGFGQLPVAAAAAAPATPLAATEAPSSAVSSSTALPPEASETVGLLQAAQESPSTSSSVFTATAEQASFSDSASSTIGQSSSTASATASESTSISVDFVVNADPTPTASTDSPSAGLTSVDLAVASTSSSVDFIVTATVEGSPTPSEITSSNAPSETFTTETAVAVESVSPLALSDAALSTAAPSAFVLDNAQATAAMISSAAASASAAAAARAEAEAIPATEVPGQRMSVLPIGLGVFGGLAGIALLVVGYVMWERKKYRGQFRRRKQAEKSLAGQGAGMGGYGTGGTNGRTYDV